MAGRHEEIDWLEDAFDDKKNDQALAEAQKASDRSCLLTLGVGAVAFVVILVLGFTALTPLF